MCWLRKLLFLLAFIRVSADRKQLINFLAGGVAGTIASTLTAPLEVIKTQLQSSASKNSNPIEIFKLVMKTDGPGGFFRGLQPLLVGIIPTRAIYFWAYGTSKSTLNATLGNTPMNHLLSAFAAGISSNTITNPLWMVKTRFQLIGDAELGQRVYKNYGEVIQSIWKEEGFGGFFKGLSASYVGCFEGAIQWIAYEKIKTSLAFSKETRAHDKALSPAEYFAAAAASKFIAICATYPHEVVRTRLREQSLNGAFKYNKGFVQALRTIAREEGRKGLYGGMPIHLLRSVPNAAIMFLSFELVNQMLTKADKAALTVTAK